jgi:hypothetical protein
MRRLALGILLIACASGPSVRAQAAPFAAIDRAAAAHEIDAAHASAFRYFAVFEPERLPSQFRADAHPTLRCATGLRLEAMSATLPPTLQPRKATALGLCDRTAPHHVDSKLYPLRVHWFNPDDHEAALRTLSAAERGWRVQVETLGFAPPLSDHGACGGDDRLDLFLVRGLGSAYTASLGDEPTTPYDDWSTFIAIDPLIFAGRYLASTTVHEFNHALQAADDWWEILTTLESTATFMEEYVYDDVDSYLPTLPSAQLLAAFPYELDDDYRTWFMYGSVMYLLFLHERYFPEDPAFIARAWHGMRSPARGAYYPRSLNEPDFADAFGEELIAHAGVTYDESVREFARWRWFTAERDDGRHFAEGASWRGALVKTIAVELPFAQTIAAPQVGGLTYLQVDTSDADAHAQLHLRLQSGDVREWHVEALRYDAGGGHDDWSAVLDTSGAGEARIPIRQATQMILFVQHAPPAGYDPDYFRTRKQGVHIELEQLPE